FRQGKVDPDYDPCYPASMNSSEETRPLHQGLLRWSNTHDYSSYDTLPQPPRRTFDLHSQSVKYQHRKSESGLSLSLEMMQPCPSTPSPICSPFDDKIYSTSASASASFSVFPDQASFAQFESLLSSQQHCSYGEEVAGSTRNTTVE
ncbi:hypothetical protein KI387_003830, partial [Taxus chinensis]